MTEIPHPRRDVFLLQPGMKIPDPAEQPTVTVEEAGAALGVSRASAYEAVRNGEIPSIKIGRRVVVPTAALRRLLAFDDEVA